MFAGVSQGPPSLVAAAGANTAEGRGLAQGVPILTAAPFSCATVTGVPISECEALVDLYNSTTGAGWTDRVGWLQNDTPCDWYGLTCSTGHVRMINLIGNQLAGPIPATINKLTELQFLFLDHNAMTGPLPPTLAQLTKLVSIEVDNNYLTGPLLPELATLPFLLNLDLDDNQFTGSIPAIWGSFPSLRTLDLDNNRLSGSLPAELGNLSSLTLLDVHSNLLTGSIPPALGNATELLSLDFSRNQLSGIVPTELGSLTKLKTLIFSDNQFSGPVPSSLTSILGLTSLAFQGTSMCEPAGAPFQTWLSAIAVVLSTEVPCTIGGRNLRLRTSAPTLSWDGGLGQTAYTLLKYNTATTAADLISLPGSALTYVDPTPDGAMYCYLLVAIEGSTTLGVSDLECALTGLQGGSLVAGNFTLALEQTSTAKLTWGTPLGGVDGYTLVVIPLSGSPMVTLPLASALTTTTHNTAGVPTCYLLISARAADFGLTNLLCGFPGLSSLHVPARLAAVTEAAASVSSTLGMLQPILKAYSGAWSAPAVNATPW